MAQWEFNRSAALLERLGVAGQADVVNLYAARAARGFGDGFAAIILPAYLLEIGFNPLQIGLVATAALLGSAATTLAIGFLAPRYHLRTLLLACAALMVVTGIAIPSFQHFVFIAAIAFIGTMNPTTGDIGVHVPLEQAALAHGVSDQDRTHVFARYSLIGALSIAAGALAAGAPDLLVSLGMGRIGALQAMFYVYAALGLVGALFYARIPRAEVAEVKETAPRASAWIRLRAASPFNRSWRFGCSSASISRSPQRARSSSGRTCSPPSPIRSRRGWANASASSTPWFSPISPRASVSFSRPSRRASPSCSRCCWCAPRSRRWTCRRARPTSWRW